MRARGLLDCEVRRWTLNHRSTSQKVRPLLPPAQGSRSAKDLDLECPIRKHLNLVPSTWNDRLDHDCIAPDPIETVMDPRSIQFFEQRVEAMSLRMLSHELLLSV